MDYAFFSAYYSILIFLIIIPIIPFISPIILLILFKKNFIGYYTESLLRVQPSLPVKSLDDLKMS